MNKDERQKAIDFIHAYLHPVSDSPFEMKKMKYRDMAIEALEQEPCEDAISRQAVIDSLHSKFANGFDSDRWWNSMSVLYAINKVPPVNPTKTEKWISVSERLPEDRREVLVTAYWHETYQVMMGSYYGDGLWWCVPFNNCGEHMQRLRPKAWMPLPKPYEPQERSDKE